MNARRRLVAMIFGGGAVACSTPTDTCACTTPPPTALVYGTMLSGAGRPITDARATATATRNACGVTAGPPVQLDAYTFGTISSTGRYRMIIRSIFAPDTVCVRVVGLRGGLNGVAVDSAIGAQVTVRTVTRSPRDSFLVDLRFP